MKRILGLFLVFFLIFTTVPAFSQAEATDYMETEICYTVLTDLGILEYNEDVRFDSYMNRGTFAQLIFNLLDMQSAGSARFLDVDETSEFYTAISAIADAGFISGHSDGNFCPYENIKFNEAIKIIVSALGYDVKAHVNGGYPYGFISVANELDILDGTAKSDPATFSDIILLIYNSLLAPVMDINKIGDDGVSFQPGRDTVLSKYRDIYAVAGVVTADSVTGLTFKSNAVLEDNIKIGNITYKNGNVDVSGLLGYNVLAFYSENDLTLQAIRKYNKMNNVLTITADQISNYNLSTGELSYEINDKQRSVTVPNSIPVIFNGVAYTRTPLEKEVFMPEVGEVNLLDNNGDSKYDVAFVKSYITYVVNTASENELFITDKLGIHADIKLKNKTYGLTKNGKKISFTDLAVDTILMVAPEYVNFKAQKNGFNYYTVDSASTHFEMIAVPENIVKGNITEVKDGDTLVIDTGKYTVSKSYIKYKNIQPQTAFFPTSVMGGAELFLDIYGNVCYIVKSTGTGEYGWITGVSPQGTFGGDISIKVFTASGKMQVFKVEDSVRLTKQRGSGASGVKGEKIPSSDLLTDSQLYPSGNFQPQLIKYTLNDKGNVKEIQLAADNTSHRLGSTEYSNIFSLEAKDMIVRFEEEDTFNSAYEYTSTAKMFIIPYRIENSVRVYDLDDKYYSMRTSKYAYETNNINLNIYDAAADGTIGAMVEFQLTQPGSSIGTEVALDARKDLFVFDKFKIGLDADGEPCKIMNGYLAGSYVSYYITNEEMKTANGGDYENVPVKDLKRGDMLRINTDDYNRLTGFIIIAHDVLNENPYFELRGYNQKAYINEIKHYSAMAMFKGDVDSVAGSVIYIDTQNPYTWGNSNAIVRRMKKFSHYYKYDTVNETIEVISSSDISEGDKVYAYMTFGNYRALVLIK